MRRALVPATLLALGATGCARGPDHTDPAPAEATPAAGTRGPAAVAEDTGAPRVAEEPPAALRAEGPPADTIFVGSRGPELAFYPDRVAGESGSVVVIHYENGGELPHNFVLVRDDGAIDVLVSAAYEAGDSGYVPLEMREELIAFSPLLSPGEAVDIEVTIPPPGEYTFICLFPGHSQMMLGTLRSR
jgi:uncharacterized cupredoxin-like copper-binding protein